MRKIIILSIIVFLLSCNKGTDNKISKMSQDSLSSTSTSDSLPVQTIIEEKNEDSIVVGNLTIKFVPSTITLFENADSTNFISKDSTDVKIIGNKWFFNLQNSEQKNLLTNDTTNDAEKYQVYSFVGNLDFAGQWLFYGTFYESDRYFLIDKKNGNTISLYGYPYISPSKKYMISGAADLIAGLDKNGIDIYEFKDGEVFQMADLPLETRGPVDFKWIDDKTILTKEYYLNDDYTEQLIRYSKILVEIKY